MKLPILSASLFSLAALAPTSLSAFTTSFPIGTFNTVGMEIAGVDGWTIDDAGQGLGGADKLSFLTTLNGSPAAAVGGWNDLPLAGAPTTVFLSHAAPVQLQNAVFSTDFAISGSTEFIPGRDGFGFSFRNSAGGNLFTISLVPVASVANDAYQVRYTVGTGTTLDAKYFNPSTSQLENMFIYQNGLYGLDFAFTENGSDPTFSATIIGSDTKTFVGTATGLGGESIARFGAEYNTIAGQEGNNFIVFDNVSLVPEPSSLLLVGLAGLGFVTRRKRA